MDKLWKKSLKHMGTPLIFKIGLDVLCKKQYGTFPEFEMF